MSVSVSPRDFVISQLVFIFLRFGQCQAFMKVLDEISFVVSKGNEISLKFHEISSEKISLPYVEEYS